MADDKTNRGPPDRNLISLNERYEVEYWTKALGCNEAKLKRAVAAVGHSAARVRTWLASN